jgi:hypothetical protein
MTKKSKERKLNESFTDMYSEEEAVDNFIYLTNKDRGKGNTTTEKHIRVCFNNHELGSLLRRLDPIAFNVN